MTDRRRTWTGRVLVIAFGLALISAWLSGCALMVPRPSPLTGEPLPTSQPAIQGASSLRAKQVAGFINKPGGRNPLTGFGESVGINGDTLVVGASNWNSLLRGIGEVFVYQRRGDEWVDQMRLTASDGADGFQYDQNFGKSVAIYGDTIVVGAPQADDQQAGDNAGGVYVFERRGEAWEETAILKAEDARPNARFGTDVKLFADTLVVTTGYGENVVYIFERQGGEWLERARLSEAGSGERYWFGFAIAIHGDWLAVSSHLDFEEDRGWGTESVHLYRRGGGEWRQITQLTGPAPLIGFGFSLAMDGETLVVGARGDREAGFVAGAAFVYEREGDTWRQQARLVAPDSTIMTGFGSSLALTGDLLVVGAAGDSEAGLWAGSAYLYQRQGDLWIVQDKLIPEDESKFGSFFGRQVSVYGDTILIAAPDEFGHAAYVYEIERD